MITLVYDDMYGTVMPEARVEGWVNSFIDDHNGYDVPITYGQELILNYFRLAIVEGRLDHNDIRVQYQDELISINEKGRLSRWPMPDRLCDVLSKLP